MTAWPTQVLATGVLVWDESGRLLMVKTTDRRSYCRVVSLRQASPQPLLGSVRCGKRSG